MNRNVPIVILNGGKSSRMGRDKSQLMMAGQSLIERAILLASQLSDRVYVSGNSSDNKLPTLPDYQTHIGPMGGILGAVESLPYFPRILFIPVDMPFLTEATLARLLKDSDSSLVLKDPEGNLIPVVASYTQEAFEIFRSFVQNGDFSLQRALRKIDYTAIDSVDARECFNINTPEDFRLISEL